MSTLKVGGIRGVSASSDAITVANDGTCTANVTNNLSNRNKIINGSMVVSQRGTSTTYSGTDFKYGACDRYKIRNSSDGGITVTQDSSVFPHGFKKSLKVDCTSADTSITGAQTVYITQFVEAQNLGDLAYGTSSAKSITISFYVRSNKTGTYCMRVQQADNGFKQAGFNYTIDSADTWERKTFTLAGDTAGVINDDNGTGLEFYWLLAAGPTYQGGSANATYQSYSNADFGAGQTVNILDNTSNEFFLTGVQVEVGTVATDFEHRLFAEELALCQRYFFGHSGGSHTVNGSNSSTPDTYLGTCSTMSTSGISFNLVLPVPMRAVPSIYSTVTGSTRYRVNSAGANSNSGSDPVIFTNGSSHILVAHDLSGFSGLQSGQSGNIRRYLGSGVLGYQAEL